MSPPLLESSRHPLSRCGGVETTSLPWELYTYVLWTENPTVGVVHQALAAHTHTTRGVLRFTVCVTDGCEMAGERSSLTKIYFHKPIRSDLLSSPSWRLVTSRVLRSLCCKYSWREVKTVRLRLRLSVYLQGGLISPTSRAPPGETASEEPSQAPQAAQKVSDQARGLTNKCLGS